MTLELRTQALIDLVAADRARRSDAVLAEARVRAAETLTAAHRQARQRMREAFDEERHLFSARVGAAQAGLETHRRLREQRRANEMLVDGLEKLPQALCDHWQQRAARDAWVEGVVAEARAVLPHGAWRIAHAPGLTDDERIATANLLGEFCDTPPEFLADAGLRAGMKIAAAGNVVDATLAGLVADRVAIGASLLKHLEIDA
ncbi:MAG: hypothetical protein ABI569_10955 [Casimicrobiaceae bacterium]